MSPNWRGCEHAPGVTPRHFLTYRDEQASAADGIYWIPRIPREFADECVKRFHAGTVKTSQSKLPYRP